MGRRTCCCYEGCWEYPDDFNDPDTTTPDNWYEQTGNWGIYGFNLVENYATGSSGTANAKIVCTKPQPSRHAGEQELSVDVYDPQTGDKYYLYPCVSTSTSIGTAIVVEFECTSGPAQWVVRAGSEEQTYTDVTETGLGYVRIGACVDVNSGQVKAAITQSAQQGLWDDSATISLGRYSGLGHNNTGRLNTFDNFIVKELRDEDDNTCDNCFCHCRDHFLKKTLTLTITDPTGRADCMKTSPTLPLSGSMVWEWNAGFSRWVCTLGGNNHSVPDGGDGGTWSRTFYLYCADEIVTDAVGDNFSLVHDPSGYCCNGGGESCVTSTPSYASCSQSALNLTFGPFKWTYLDLSCVTCYNPMVNPPAEGSYYVVITN